MEGRGERYGVTSVGKSRTTQLFKLFELQGISCTQPSQCTQFETRGGGAGGWARLPVHTYTRVHTNPPVPQFPDVTAVERAPPPSEAPTSKRIVARGICLRPDEWDYLPSNRRRLSDRGPRQGRRSHVCMCANTKGTYVRARLIIAGGMSRGQ